MIHTWHWQWAVWRDVADYHRHMEPVAVCTSHAAAKAVARLFEPQWDARWGSRRGWWPHIDQHWTHCERPELHEDVVAREAEERRIRQAGEDWAAGEYQRRAERMMWEGYPEWREERR